MWLLSTFIHEQSHWYLVAHQADVDAAVAELHTVAPGLPVGFPQGADTERSSYEHLIVIALEERGLVRLAGELAAEQAMEFWAGDHYRVLYRVVLEKRADIDAFAAELTDRFGELPNEVRHLMDVMEIKALAKAAGLQQLDAGPKGAVLAFRKNQFANPEGLIGFIQKSRGQTKMQPDHKLVFKADWDQDAQRLKGVRALVQKLAEIAQSARKPA